MSSVQDQKTCEPPATVRSSAVTVPKARMGNPASRSPVSRTLLPLLRARYGVRRRAIVRLDIEGTLEVVAGGNVVGSMVNWRSGLGRWGCWRVHAARTVRNDPAVPKLHHPLAA